MIFDERLAALGVETSDILPSNERCNGLYEKFYAVVERICKEMGEEFDLEMLLSYLIIAIAKRDEIIDRMETRLDNVIGEREYLLDRMWGENPCVICENAKREGGCAVDICEFEFAGVPENWRAHDD